MTLGEPSPGELQPSLLGSCLNDRYRLDAVLGRGGMGTVYRAHDTLLGRDVAVKVLLAGMLGTEGQAQLLREAQAVAQLNHPNVVTVHDVGEAEGALFIVMELVEGESLHTRAAGVLCPEGLDEIVGIAQQVCAALAHAHSHGIVHRDLKPENVLLVSGVEPGPPLAKLVDFGLARSVASRLTQDGTLAGTVFYLAPELALGRAYDGRADLYALGVMLYELTTGRLPFEADDPLAIISQHLHAPVVPLRARNPDVPVALDALIVQLLSKDPAERPVSAAEVRRRLAAPGVVDREAAPARELTLLERIDRGRLVGRQCELQEGRSLWNQALSGQGQVLLISGEPGIGKTRLVRELATHAEVTGGWALGGASYAEGSVPYAPFAQIVRRALGNGADDSLNLPDFVWADVLALAPDLCLRHPDIQPRPALEDPRAEQHRLFENLAVFFSALSNETPLLLILEDVHWADSGTLFLMRHLARHCRQQRVMMVATHRDVELDEARLLHEVLLDFRRERLASHLKLPRLNRKQTEALLAVFFDEEITPEFLAGIYGETEGNPFFIEEVVRALVESGKLRFADGRWHRPSIEELGIPQTVRVAIQSRVRVLSPEAQEALCVAAVLGREFEFEVLVEASQHHEEMLIEALEEAERAQLIDKVGAEGRKSFAFVHGLVPSTLVEGLRTMQRRRLHRQAAAAIAARCPHDFEILAHHCSQAGQADQAAGYRLKAGDRARGLYAHQEAIDHYQQALEFLKGVGDLERAGRTLMKLGLTYHSAFAFKAARQAYEEGFVIWQRIGDVRRAEPPPPAPHALRLATFGPVTLDPGLCFDRESTIVIHQLFSGLVEQSPELDVLPDVAHSWEVLESGCKYVFHLRDDARWSDGAPVTAADFEYAWKRVLDPAIGSPLASLLYDIQGARAYHRGDAPDPERVGVRALDETTLTVQLEGPSGYFPHILAHNATFPVPRHVVQVYGTTWTDLDRMVTNGPFRLAAWERGASMVIERNPTYHGPFSGNVVRVESSFGMSARLLQMYADDRLEAFSLYCLPEADWDRARQRYAGEYLSAPELATYYVGFDGSRPPFDDPRVRRAFTLATNREALADVRMRGYVFPATGGLVPPGMPGHSRGIGLAYDPKGARHLLDEAGYPRGGRFPALDALVPADRPFAVSYFEHLRAQWLENLGIEIAWKEMEWGRFLDRVDRKPPHLWFMGWSADYPDPDNFLRAGPWRTRTGWQHRAYDELVEEARRVVDQEERMGLYQQAEAILTAEAPILLLCYARLHLLVKPWVRQYPTSPMKPCFWKNVVLEPH